MDHILHGIFSHFTIRIRIEYHHGYPSLENYIVTQFIGVLRNVKVGYAMPKYVAKFPNPAAISFCNADYSVKHLNENNETTKLVQALINSDTR